MAKLSERNPASAPGDWYIDRRCIDCGASREAAPGMIVHRKGKSVFARQPANEEEERAAWRAVLVCPTASVGTGSHRSQAPDLFPQELAPGLYRCGYNAESSFGAHAYFVKRPEGNLLVDSPRHVKKLVQNLEDLGGVSDILLSHQDDVADAGRYAKHFSSRVWIHEDDARAAPYATDLLRSGEPEDLVAFRDACWYSWSEQKSSLAKLADRRFEWVLAGHGGSIRLPAEEMRARLRALVDRM